MLLQRARRTLRRFSDKLLAAVISKESLGKDFLAEAEFMSIVQNI